LWEAEKRGRNWSEAMLLRPDFDEKPWHLSHDRDSDSLARPLLHLRERSRAKEFRFAIGLIPPPCRRWSMKAAIVSDGCAGRMSMGEVPECLSDDLVRPLQLALRPPDRLQAFMLNRAFSSEPVKIEKPA
jgi:hypothetical protein